uniref:Profilin n=1 Tax=Labrus bergylta TaxID=56723 RepID=A0A3Q3E9E9_9LABR
MLDEWMEWMDKWMDEWMDEWVIGWMVTNTTTCLSLCQKEEIRKMAHDRKDFPINGAFLAGRKCRFLRDQMDADQIYCCTFKTAQADDGTSVNVCVGKTNQAFAKKDVGGGPLNERVYKIVSYLRASNM